ncbi:hypothetical protein ANCDUO_24803 [Ancylostoma duodenale]|uniref:Nematode fatty acid retinoid binding protein n=1 Tax=Ancylostoma duodenale TaxID=51022 RepID=A0A0C2F9M3_9BILA|nr:hypothetical protein ANCDUO_24803 [Ancylostoma duodenale]
MVAAVNDIETGKIKIPKNAQKIVDYIAKRTPQLGDNIDRAMDDLMDNVNKLRPETKTAFNKVTAKAAEIYIIPRLSVTKPFFQWWSRVFETVSVPREQLANRIARLISDFKAAYDKASQAIKDDVRKVWPEAYNLLESDFADKFAVAAKKFADGGLTMDIHMVTYNIYFKAVVLPRPYPFPAKR